MLMTAKVHIEVPGVIIRMRRRSVLTCLLSLLRRNVAVKVDGPRTEGPEEVAARDTAASLDIVGE